MFSPYSPKRDISTLMYTSDSIWYITHDIVYIARSRDHIKQYINIPSRSAFLCFFVFYCVFLAAELNNNNNNKTRKKKKRKNSQKRVVFNITQDFSAVSFHIVSPGVTRDQSDACDYILSYPVVPSSKAPVIFSPVSKVYFRSGTCWNLMLAQAYSSRIDVAGFI